MRGILDRCPAAVDPRVTHPPAPVGPVTGWLSRRLDHQVAMPANGFPNLRPTVSASCPTAFFRAPCSSATSTNTASAYHSPATFTHVASSRNALPAPNALARVGRNHLDHAGRTKTIAAQRPIGPAATRTACRPRVATHYPSGAGRVHRVRLTARCSGRGRCLVRSKALRS